MCRRLERLRLPLSIRRLSAWEFLGGGLIRAQAGHDLPIPSPGAQGNGRCGEGPSGRPGEMRPEKPGGRDTALCLSRRQAPTDFRLLTGMVERTSRLRHEDVPQAFRFQESRRTCLPSTVAVRGLERLDGRLLDGLAFCTTAYDVFEEILGTPAGLEELRLLTSKRAKRLMEELLPLARYVQSRYVTGRVHV